MSPNPREPNPIDRHVGSRVRLRRQMMAMSQEKLGEELGVTFQQVQKYERGANRIGAGRLWHLARVLEVPVAFFYDGATGTAQQPTGFAEGDQTPIVNDFLQSPDGVALAQAFSKITDPKVRRRVLELVRSLADTDQAAE
ncbi:XRE family transcriptional regulator [Glycocaulis alkaliphilus]|uniref:XRE family transcriptional regulator n=1 Tax=Glycocaulis alkaliphilus TaxID=1434191 RepID=A0A3T0E5Z3_9PROT|nr:helix-turn-helix domain-containing protein [Glycocaulis alkaliphilus]AZU02729.1 XRE family transcriptional regulator [Glycocaulis alkaliphilus]GGB79453.1 transcriptional regulator [Glycocaulis alkaliphilus]